MNQHPVGDLVIPDVSPDDDLLTAAIKYANAGIYLVPVAGGSKNPGSVVGARWQHQSSTDPKQIALWLSGTSHGIAMHAGRSGLMIFDVDYPELVPEVLRKHLVYAPHQSSRPDEPRRGHYLFAQPPGRNIGNSTGRLGGGWGDVRGLNGVIVLTPTPHCDGGKYHWEKTGLIPVLPDELAELLPDAEEAADSVSSAEVKAFIDAHTAASRPDVLSGLRSTLESKIAAGASRHDSARNALVGALKEARAGYYSARTAVDTLKPIFVNAATQPGVKQRTARAAAEEWHSLERWAVAQANAADLVDVHARVSEQMPETVTIDPAGEGQHWQPDADAPVGWQAHTIRDFIHRTRQVKNLWGDGDEVAWAEGESMMIASPMGLGKTTLAGRLARAQKGLDGGQVLGMPVAPIDGRILYLACDRPLQIARSMARQWTEAELELFNDGSFIVRSGPPPADIAKQPEILLRMARYYEADVLYVDSLKDLAVGLSSDEVAAGYNRARQSVLAADIQMCELHHVVKRTNQGNGGRITDIADVYGGVWLTAGCGSVIALSGKPNDAFVQLDHLRAPMQQIGPWTLEHNHEAGTIELDSEEYVDLVAMADCADGVTVASAAQALYATSDPNRSQKRKASRRLEKLTDDGQLIKISDGAGKSAAWFPAPQTASSTA